MARLAGLREVRRHVVRIGRALEVLQVARNAGSRRDVVVVIGVAIAALPRRHGVQAGQSKTGRGVIEHPVGPKVGVVTLFAGRGESR